MASFYCDYVFSVLPWYASNFLCIFINKRFWPTIAFIINFEESRRANAAFISFITWFTFAFSIWFTSATFGSIAIASAP